MPHRLLCVHPHPDDESISCGGVIAQGVRAGTEVHVVTCTGGEEGENQSGVDLGGRPMEQVRREEMAAAIVALGGPDHHWLGYRDSGMVGESANEHPDAFHGAPLDEAAARLATVIRSVRPHVVVSDDELGTYGHPDHVKAHVVTTRAVELAADPSHAPDTPAWDVPKRYVFALTKERVHAFHEALVANGLASPFGSESIPDPADIPFGAPASSVTTVVDVRDVLDIKRAAMAAHASQIGEDSFFLNVPEGFGEDLFGVEEFILLRGASGADGPQLEDDLFAGVSA